MSASSESSGTVGLLELLPALSLIILLGIFSLQALQAPVERARAQQAELNHPALDPERSLPKLGQIPHFSLTERSEKTVGLEQLQGKVWVANFIFTRCTTECPLMNIEMQKIQSAFAEQGDLGLLSITVDPETDNPARLRDYAEALQADPEHWLFLTGEREALHQLTIQGFKLPVQELSKPNEHAGHSNEPSQHGSNMSRGPFLHSQKFVLLDAELQIRGYYDSTDPAAMQRLIEKDIPALLPTS